MLFRAIGRCLGLRMQYQTRVRLETIGPSFAAVCLNFVAYLYFWALPVVLRRNRVQFQLRGEREALTAVSETVAAATSAQRLLQVGFLVSPVLSKH